MTHITPVNAYGTAKWIVSATPSQGTHTTITAAVTAASAGDTIFIRDGTYIENVTLKPSVNICCFSSNGTGNASGNVIINGTLTLSVAGSVSISGIELQTNSAPILVVSGSGVSQVNLTQCFFNCTNNTAISFTNSNASSEISIGYCSGNLATTGIAFYSSSSPGDISIYYTDVFNTGNSTTASNNSSGVVFYTFSGVNYSITTSSTGILNNSHSNFETPDINTACITSAGTGSVNSFHCQYGSGTAPCFSIGVGTSFGSAQDILSSTNTNAIAGGGTLVAGIITFVSSSSTIEGTLTVNKFTTYGGTIV